MTLRTRFDTLEPIDWLVRAGLAVAVVGVLLLMNYLLGGAPLAAFRRVPTPVVAMVCYALPLVSVNWRRDAQRTRRLVALVVGMALVSVMTSWLDR